LGQVDGVYAASEYGVDAASHLARQLGVPHHGRAAQAAMRGSQVERPEFDYRLHGNSVLCCREPGISA
jgi:hypothetical protein